jgi:hypothetical protein
MLSRVYLGYHTVAQVRGPEFRIRSDWERITVQRHCFVPTSHAVLGFQRNIERIEL